MILTKWTAEREARAIKLWQDGLSADRIARELGGTTRNAVIGLMHRRGHKRRAPSPLKNRAVVPAAAPARKQSTPKVTPPTAARVAAPVFSWGKGTASVPKPADLDRVRAAEASPVDPVQLKTLMERGERECAWPVGAPDPVRGQLFCSRHTDFRKSYCPAHSPAQPAALRRDLFKGEGLRSRQAEPADSELDLTELLA